MYKQIAILLDDSPESQHALETAVNIASAFGAQVHILTLLKSLPSYTAYAVAADPQIAEILEKDHIDGYERLEAEAYAFAERSKLVCAKHRIEGHEVNTVLTILEREAVDLLVLGLHRRSSVVSRMWNRTFELAQDSSCSLLGVH